MPLKGLPVVRLLLCAGGLMLLWSTAMSGESAGLGTLRKANTIDPLPPGSIVLRGWIGEAIETCRRGGIMGQSVEDLVGPFAEREEDKQWRGEFWGKWFTSAALAYRYQADEELREKLQGAVAGMIATQTADGALTTYKKEAEFSNWDTWGRKYTLLGLLAWHEVAGDEEALAAARRHADRIVDYFGPGKADIAKNGMWTGMAAGSILEPMVLLYRRTGDRKYLEFAEYIVEAWEGAEGPDLVRKALAGVPVYEMFPGPDPSKPGYMSGGSSKAYEMMSCYEGLIELYRSTGEARYREAAVKVFENIRTTEITILGSGSSWERWCRGRSRQTEAVPEWMETCVTVTWMKLAGQLLRLTGEASYADEIERTVYNSLLGAQKGDGTWWCHYSPLEGKREAAPEQCAMHANCCVANGPRGLMLAPMLAVMQGERGPVINLFEAGTAKVPLASGRSVELEIVSDYPRDGKIEIVVNPKASEEFELCVRIPGWSKETRLLVNDEEIEGIEAGKYARVNRLWKAGDRVRLELDMTARLVRDPEGKEFVAVECGPLVFAVDRRVTRELETGEHIVADGAGRIAAVEVGETLPEGMRMAIDVPVEGPEGKGTVRLCDYASAGQTWTEESALRVWMPVRAEK